MRAIGLTGGIASGKTTVAARLSERGAVVIDADIVGHEVYRPELPAWTALIEAFGRGIVAPDGTIDRRQLGARVFNNPAEMQRLTDIVWPEMKRVMAERLDGLRRDGVPVAVVEAAVLLEAGWQDLVDEVWTVVVPPAVAAARVMERNQLSEEQARARIASQLSNAERIRGADLVIENSGSREDLLHEVDSLWQAVLQRAA